MKTIHFILNFFMILILSIAMFFMDLFSHILNSGKETFKDAVDNIKYAYSQKFN